MANDVVLDLSGFDRILREEPARVAAWLDGFAEGMVSDIVESFGDSPPGAEYTRRGITHVASQPGYPPNVDTGTLRASMRWERRGQLIRHILDGVEYGIYLEDGTETIAPRPFMQPAFDRASGRMEADARMHLNIEGT